MHPSLRREETFKKLSAETDFFAFYFQQNSRQQLFAANALKTQGWRFHTQASEGRMRAAQLPSVCNAGRCWDARRPPDSTR